VLFVDCPGALHLDPLRCCLRDEVADRQNAETAPKNPNNSIFDLFGGVWAEFTLKYGPFLVAVPRCFEKPMIPGETRRTRGFRMISC